MEKAARLTLFAACLLGFLSCSVYGASGALPLRHMFPFLQSHDTGAMKGRPDKCAALCWEFKDPDFGLTQTWQLQGCLQFNVTSSFKRNPKLNGWDLLRLEGKGTYIYRNRWEDFSLGDSTYAFQSWKDRWLWNVDFTELVHTQIFQTEANPEPDTKVFDSIKFTSVTYKIFNATAIVEEEANLQQQIPFSGPITQTASRNTAYHRRLLSEKECNNSMG